MSTENGGNYAAFSPWTWRDRLRFRLFPTRLCDLPEAPAHFEDCLVVTTHVYHPWRDRLRVLLTGWVCVRTRTVTEHRVGGHKTTSVAYPIISPERQQ